MKISFVMPVYNCQGTVARAIQSLIDQKHQDKEIIVVDDGSTDYTARICRSFNKDINFISKIKRPKINKEKILFIDRSERAGAAKCRNIAMEVAQGDIIAVCDADYYFPERGTVINKFFEKYPKKSVFYSGLYIQDGQRKYEPMLQGAYEWDFNSKCPIPHATVAYRSHVAITCPYHEDSMETDLYEFMLLDAHKKDYQFGGSQNPLMIKTEGNSARKTEEAKILKLKKYKEYGINI